MAYFRNPSDAFYKNLQIAIPLILQDKRLEFAKQQSDEQFAQNKQLLVDQANQLKEQLAMETAVEQYEQALQSGDPNIVSAAAEPLEALGIPALRGRGTPSQPEQIDPSGQLAMSQGKPGELYVPPKQVTPEKPPKTLEEVIARAATPEQAKTILQQLKSVSKSTGPKTFENMLVQMFPDQPEMVLDYLSRLKATGGAGNKELQRLEDDIMQIANKMSSVESGQDIVSEAIGSKRAKVVEDLAKRLFMTLKRYRDKGGDPKRLGFDLDVLEVQEKQSEIMDIMPDASEHKGKIIRDTETGKRYKSDGKQWVEIK